MSRRDTAHAPSWHGGHAFSKGQCSCPMDCAARSVQLINLSRASISLVCNVELNSTAFRNLTILVLALNTALSFPCILDTKNASFFLF